MACDTTSASSVGLEYMLATGRSTTALGNSAAKSASTMSPVISLLGYRRRSYYGSLLSSISQALGGGEAPWLASLATPNPQGGCAPIRAAAQPQGRRAGRGRWGRLSPGPRPAQARRPRLRSSSDRPGAPPEPGTSIAGAPRPRPARGRLPSRPSPV